ncbi:hypothetical protein JCM16303_006080 [Sporobolomyces ruberrimus]
MPRSEGRSNLSLRPLAISQSLLSRADGSSQFSFGNVTVLTSVTGPTEVRLREELVDRATLEFNLNPLVGLPGPRVKSMEETIETLFSHLILSNLYPRSLIQITSQTTSSPSTLYSEPFSTTILEEEDASTRKKGKGRGKGGKGVGEQAARINSITMALIDSGVQLRGLLVAVAVAFLPTTTTEGGEEDEMVLDPDCFEEEKATSTHVVTVGFGEGVGGKEGQVVGTESLGRFSQDQLFEAQDVALEATRTIFGFMRKSIEAKYGVETSSTSPATTTTPTTEGSGKGDKGEIKMCVAEEGREMSDFEEGESSEDEVMI